MVHLGMRWGDWVPRLFNIGVSVVCYTLPMLFRDDRSNFVLT